MAAMNSLIKLSVTLLIMHWPNIQYDLNMIQLFYPKRLTNIGLLQVHKCIDITICAASESTVPMFLISKNKTSIVTNEIF